MSGTADDVPMSGSIPLAGGIGSVVQIPIPGTPRLAVSLRTNSSFRGSTSTLFIQDRTGRRYVLRLDYGENKSTNRTVNYHWNVDRLHSRFGIANHTVVGRAGAAAYHAARAYRYVGGVLLVGGVLVDAVSVVQADRPLRRATQVVSAWALAYAGCKVGGYVGGGAGTLAAPGLGTAGGAFAGCIIGGFAGYRAGERLGDVVYQWAEGTVFTPLPQVPVP